MQKAKESPTGGVCGSVQKKNNDEGEVILKSTDGNSGGTKRFYGLHFFSLSRNVQKVARAREGVPGVVRGKL